MTNETLSDKLQAAIDQAFEIDNAIAALGTQIGVLIGDMQGDKRPQDAGVLIGFSANLRDSFYRKMAGTLQDMQ